MDRDALLLTIAEKGYDVAFGVRKTFATYDFITKLPGWVSLLSFAVGTFALIYDQLSAKLPSAILLIVGVAALYLAFYRPEEYERSANKMLSQYDRLKDLYRSVQSGYDLKLAKAEFDAINAEYRATSIGRQVFMSNWYAHYKLFAEVQYRWMDEQLHFTWKDKWPVSARIAIMSAAIAIVAGLVWWFARHSLCG